MSRASVRAGGRARHTVAPVRDDGSVAAPREEGRYQQLEDEHVLRTVDRLRARIDARFGDRGLTRVAGELVGLVERVERERHEAQRRIARVRMLVWIASVAIVGIAAAALVVAVLDVRATSPGHAVDWVPLVESGVNNLVYVAVAVLFLWAVPERTERSGLLALLHRLRSLAHVVDMHQLTKEPERYRAGYRPTSESLQNTLAPEEMHHYLDYCTELLSLVAKTAALCAERSSDGTVLETVSDIERLTTDMSTKIFQKITLLERLAP